MNVFDILNVSFQTLTYEKPMTFHGSTVFHFRPKEEQTSRMHENRYILKAGDYKQTH